MKHFSRWVGGIVTAVVTLSGAGLALAQGFPNKSIKMIVPYPPGGPTDVQARIVAQKLGDLLGQSVVIENRMRRTAACWPSI